METIDFIDNVRFTAHTPWFNFGPSITVLVKARVELVELGEGEPVPVVTHMHVFNEDGSIVEDRTAEALINDTVWNYNMMDRCTAQYLSNNGLSERE